MYKPRIGAPRCRSLLRYGSLICAAGEPCSKAAFLGGKAGGAESS